MKYGIDYTIEPLQMGSRRLGKLCECGNRFHARRGGHRVYPDACPECANAARQYFHREYWKAKKNCVCVYAEKQTTQSQGAQP